MISPATLRFDSSPSISRKSMSSCCVLQIVIAPHVRQVGCSISVTGPERRAANLAPRWRSLDIQVVVCYPRRGNLADKFKQAHLTVVDFEIGNKLNVSAAYRIAKLAKQHAVQLIHTQGPPSLDMLACFGGRLVGVPVLVTRPVMVEDQVTYPSWRRRLYSIIDRATTLRLAQRIITVSRAGYQHLRDHCRVRSERLQLIYNGIDLHRFPPRSSTDNRGEVTQLPVVIGMVAQLFPPKGWPDFIEVIDRLRQQGLHVRGLIVGEGELREELERDVARRELQSTIEFSGFQENVAVFYGQMDFLLFTTHREGLSVAVIEAMASGLPIVATDVGGIREQVDDGLNGYIVEVGNHDAMVNSCTKLIQDPHLRAAMGRLSHQIAKKRFSETRMLQEHADCYRGIVGQRIAPSRTTGGSK